MAENQITVVIAVKNGMPFVIEAVRSALGQGDAVKQVIVVDDNSLDDTCNAVKAISDRRVVVIANPGRGVSSARNAGAALAGTRWLLFLDADDRLAEGAVAHLLTAVSQTPDAVGAYGDYERIDEAGRRTGRRFLMRARRKPSGAILNDLMRGNFIINGGIIIVSRDIYIKIGGFDPALSLCEDWHLWCRLAALGSIIYTPKLVMDYRVHPASVMMGKQRVLANFMPALDAIYRDPYILSAISSADIALARREAQISLMTYCAAQAWRNGAKRDGVTMAFDAIRQHPKKAPWIMARVGGAIAGL